jgi:hypothetical protein
MNKNLELWDAVSRTNEKNTKPVNQRGGFTAIDAHSQIKAATEAFGAAGKGWGWAFSDPIFTPNNTVILKCVLWHGNKDQTVEQFGQKKLGRRR